MLNYYKLVRLSGFAWDFYFSSVSMSLYLSVSLCISLYLSLSLPSISPKPNLTLNKPADLPSHRPTPLSLSPPPPLSHLLPLSLTSSLSLCRIFLLLKLIFGWTNSLIIQMSKCLELWYQPHMCKINSETKQLIVALVMIPKIITEHLKSQMRITLIYNYSLCYPFRTLGLLGQKTIIFLQKCYSSKLFNWVSTCKTFKAY